MSFLKRIILKLEGKRCGICKYCDLSQTIHPIPYHDALERCVKYQGRAFRVTQSHVCEDFVEAEKTADESEDKDKIIADLKWKLTQARAECAVYSKQVLCPDQHFHGCKIANERIAAAQEQIRKEKI